MIERTYHSSVNCANPEGYFENFYAHCWYNVAKINQLDSQRVIVDTVREELQKYGAAMVWHFNSHLFSVKYANDEDYTMFKLAWA